MYVRKEELPAIDPKHRPEFRTKLELAVELLRWAKTWLWPGTELCFRKEAAIQVSIRTAGPRR